MKKIGFVLSMFFLFGINVFAQQGISYQAVARNAGGFVIGNQNISVKFDLHQGSTTGTSVFAETHNVTTNPFGLFMLSMGSVSTSQFLAINWGNGPYFLEVLMDPAGGTSYTSVGTQQVMSVPYALYAKTAASVNLISGNGIGINSNTITNTAPNQTVTINGSGVIGSYPNYTVNAVGGGTTTLVQGNNITLNNVGSTYTVNAASYSISQSGSNLNLLQNGSAIATVSLNSASNASLTAGNSNITVSQSGNAFTVTPVVPTITGTGVTNVSGTYPTLSVNTPSSTLSYTAVSKEISLTQGASVSTITLTNVGNVNGTGTPGVLPMWSGANTLANSPVSTFTNSGGVVINPNVVGTGSPAQSLQVHGPNSGSTYVAHFLFQHSPNTGLGFSTQLFGGHAIGTIDNQDLGFFTNNTNVVGGYPLVLKTNGLVGIANNSPLYNLDVGGSINSSTFLNVLGLPIQPPVSSGNEGRIYFDRAVGQKIFKVSENGGAWVPLVNNLWTKGTGILFNTTLTDNVGVGTNTPGNRLEVLSNTPGSTLKATNTGGGNAIEGATNNSGSAGVLGYNDGAGPSIAGSKSVSAASGNAGRFEIFNGGNPSDALVAVAKGNGAGVRAINTSTNAGASNLSLVADNGHLKATFTNNITNSDVGLNANTFGPLTFLTSNSVDQSNDVRGAITLNSSSTFALLPNSAKSTILTVSFKKPYKQPPVIVVTSTAPASLPDNIIVSTQILNVALTDFTVRVCFNYVGTGTAVNFPSFTLYYMVME